MKYPYLLLLPIAILTSCNIKVTNSFTSRQYYFDTFETITLYEGNKEDCDYIAKIFEDLDKDTNNYSKDNQLYKINTTEDEIEISPLLYNLLNRAYDLKPISHNYFNPLIGSLSNKWKESLKKEAILSDDIIQNELAKMASTNLNLSIKEGKYCAQKTGQAEVDLGAITKGYALDLVKEYLLNKGISKFLIDCGSSSILLGEKTNNNGYFKVGLNIPGLENAYYINAKDVFIGASGTSEQGVEIDGKMYSHIVNPFTGSVNNNYDYVLVLGDNGALCDALSTSFMMMEIDEIKEIETAQNISTIIYKDKKIAYKSDNIEVIKK